MNMKKNGLDFNFEPYIIIFLFLFLIFGIWSALEQIKEIKKAEITREVP